MKKYKIIVTIVILCILVFFIIRHSSIGSIGYINRKFTSNISENSVIPFSLEKKDNIIIIYDVTAEEGTLKIQLEDDCGNIIEDFEVNQKGNKEYL